MTCRIERVSGKTGVFLRVSGGIQAEDVDLLRDLLASEKGIVTIDLKDVIIVNREAVGLLAFSEGNGIALRNCPSYVRAWIDRERTIVEPLNLKTGAKDDVEDV